MGAEARDVCSSLIYTPAKSREPVRQATQHWATFSLGPPSLLH